MTISRAAMHLVALGSDHGHGWTVAIAKRLGTDTALVSRWASGDRSPSRSWAVKLRDELGIAIEDWDRFDESGPLPASDDDKTTAAE